MCYFETCSPAQKKIYMEKSVHVLLVSYTYFESRDCRVGTVIWRNTPVPVRINDGGCVLMWFPILT